MTSPPRRRTWVWFFAVLIVLTIIASVIPLIVVPQLHGLVPVTPALLRDARAAWERNGPLDYDLEYQKKGSVANTFVVQVRNRQAVSVLMDGQPIEPRLYRYHTMEALVDDLERFLDLASKPDSPAAILQARFHPIDGHLVRYLYSVPTTRQQIEVSVKLRPVNGRGG